MQGGYKVHICEYALCLWRIAMRKTATELIRLDLMRSSQFDNNSSCFYVVYVI